MAFRPPLTTPSFDKPVVPPSVSTTTVPPPDWARNDPRSTGQMISDTIADLVAQGVDPDVAAVEAVKATAALAAVDGERTAGLVEQSSKIVDKYAGQIASFIQANRRAVELSELAVRNDVASFLGLNVYYSNQFGREEIRYVTFPEAFPGMGATGPKPEKPGISLVYLLAVEFGDKDQGP